MRKKLIRKTFKVEDYDLLLKIIDIVSKINIAMNKTLVSDARLKLAHEDIDSLHEDIRKLGILLEVLECTKLKQNTDELSPLFYLYLYIGHVSQAIEVYRKDLIDPIVRTLKKQVPERLKQRIAVLFVTKTIEQQNFEIILLLERVLFVLEQVNEDTEIQIILPSEIIRCKTIITNLNTLLNDFSNYLTSNKHIEDDFLIMIITIRDRLKQISKKIHDIREIARGAFRRWNVFHGKG